MKSVLGALGCLLASTLLAAPAGAAERARTVEIDSVGGYEPAYSLRFTMPFENLLRSATDVVVLDVENVPAAASGDDFKLTVSSGAPSAAGPAAALENVDGFFTLIPPDPELMASFLSVARGYAQLPPTYERRATLGARGSERDVSIESPRRAAPDERETLASVYHLNVRGRSVDAVFLMKMNGGLGRLASALEGLPSKPARIVVSRGTWEFRASSDTLSGRELWDSLESMGVKVSGVGRGELRRWEELKDYRKERPDGVQFVSANLKGSELPGAVVVSTGGVSVAFIGATRSSYSKYVAGDAFEGVSLAPVLASVRDQVRAARAKADLVVVLSNLERSENARLCDSVRGIDVVVADSQEQEAETQDPRPLSLSSRARGPFSSCLLLLREYDGVDRVSLTVGPKDAAGYRPVSVAQRQVILDDSVPEADGYPRFSAAEFSVSPGSSPALLPSARKLFPQGNPAGGTRYPRLVSRDFWSLSASLMADRTGSELALFPVTNIGLPTPGDFAESELRGWFGWDDALVTFELSGDKVKALTQEAAAEREQERSDFAPEQRLLRLAAGGVGPGGAVHGVPIDDALVYRVAGTRLLLANAESYPALAEAQNVEEAGDLQDAVIADLKERAAESWSPRKYASLTQGLPVRETPYWTVNFRDIGFNFTQTDVVKNAAAFAAVNDPRIQGFNETDVGADAKVDAEYRYGPHKWSNTLEAEYSESRLRPLGQPDAINVPDNRTQLLTTETERLGSFPFPWLGASVGPSLGLEYDGEVKQLATEPKRRNIYSAFPGVELYDGSVVNSLQLTGNVRRDYSTETVQEQYGARLRFLVETPVPLGRGGEGKLQSEVWADYFFHRHGDTDQDLLYDSDVDVKLQIPVWRDLTIAPFVDIYFFALKLQPSSGYSAQTGVSLSFSRLWKPQYEKFF